MTFYMQNFYLNRLSQREEDEERRANYERYRTLVENESAGGNESVSLDHVRLARQCLMGTAKNSFAKDLVILLF